MKKDEKTITVTGYGGYEHEQTIKEFIMDLIPLLIMLGLIILGLVVSIDYQRNKPKYDTAVIVGDTTSNIIHIDHYEERGNRYVLYDKDGRVYEANRELVVFYNYKED